MELKTNQIKMNMREAVLYAEAQFNDGINAFFINSEFGKIGIEANGCSLNNPLHPTLAFTWKTAPETDWTIANKNTIADYYVSVDIVKSNLSDHLAIIEALSRCMFINLGCQEINDGIIDAAISSFVNYYDEKELTVNALQDEYEKCNLNMICRRNDAVKIILRELIENRSNTATIVREESIKLLEEYKSTSQIVGEFSDAYCEQMFAISLYANSEQQKSVDAVSNKLINFEIEERKVKTDTFIAAKMCVGVVTRKTK